MLLHSWGRELVLQSFDDGRNMDLLDGRQRLDAVRLAPDRKAARRTQIGPTVLSLLICAVKNSATRCFALGIGA